MKQLKISGLILMMMFLGLAACAARDSEDATSGQKVIHGEIETEYPYVVQIFMDRGGMCTGSFVSDSLLVTAAHCIDQAKSLTWNGIAVERSDFFIHDAWPTVLSGCSQARHPKFDLALVRFPAGSYQGAEYAKLLQRRPINGEILTIVGYGNNHIEPFASYCTLPTQPRSDGRCYVLKGVLNQANGFDFSAILGFDPAAEASRENCSAPCSFNGLRTALASFGIIDKDFVFKYCDGNFRDRGYRETGAGVKRSGSNMISQVRNGVIEFQGPISSGEHATDSTSGAGDSGGPLLIFDRGQQRLAGITHGGSLFHGEQDLSKRSIYLDITAAHSIYWIRQTVLEHQLDFPEL